MNRSDRLICPLCAESSIEHFHSDRKRDYFRCNRCLLVFVPPDQQLSLQQQKQIYDWHQNDVQDEGYRKFLSRLAIPLTYRLKEGASGLDFGCGPGPALSAMLTEQGFSTAVYDPIYADHVDIWRRAYDFITCTEVAEHFTKPGFEFRRMFSLLKPGGFIGIMTKRVTDLKAFGTWHYKNDPTHVCFFSEATFRWLAEEYRCQLELTGTDVAILQRQN